MSETLKENKTNQTARDEGVGSQAVCYVPDIRLCYFCNQKKPGEMSNKFLYEKTQKKTIKHSVCLSCEPRLRHITDKAEPSRVAERI